MSPHVLQTLFPLAVGAQQPETTGPTLDLWIRYLLMGKMLLDFNTR